MYENKFDRLIDEIGNAWDLNWNDDSKVRLFARFLELRHAELFWEFEKFLEGQALEESNEGGLQ